MKIATRQILARMAGNKYAQKYWCFRCQRSFWTFTILKLGPLPAIARGSWKKIYNPRCPRCGNNSKITSQEEIEL
jgi:DNA-directed RNA polymerase subunit RPC12/RpoP